ncbi:hypothetical protein [Cupriavidus metallidurans]|uniref:Uncharacterized protein n=1 Tax=Cupriavidus metallidurans TaxID=119219 RepID=A0A482IQI1_9BURK|nr:hypothetical protein [Cupriavidus metallidurans]QBP09863.1 hypothetical protein DDF84_008860 [Cupriavidus metallidurans]
MGMSEDIARLTTAAQDLVNTFTGKAAAIDASVAAALQAAPSMQRTYVVDSVAGDDAAAGTVAAPLRTIKKAVDLTPSGGSVEILLKPAQVFLIDADINVVNKIVRIDRQAVGTKPIIRPKGYLDTGGLNANYGFYGFGGTILFLNCTLESASKTDAAKANGFLLGLLRRCDLATLTVAVFGCDVVLQGLPLAHIAAACQRTDMWMYIVSITTPGAGMLVVSETNPFTLYAANMTLPGGTTIASLITGMVKDTNAVPVPRNVESNLVL